MPLKERPPKPPRKSPAGRKSPYKEEFAEQARKLCLLGATDKDLAGFFKVTEACISKWKHDFPEFYAALCEGKSQADAKVADRLYNRALGYSHEAVKIFMPPGAKEPIYAPFIQHYPPDTQAATFWLKNRQPEKWKDKAATEITGANGQQLVIVTGVPRPDDWEPQGRGTKATPPADD